jgi:hypothetical protein
MTRRGLFAVGGAGAAGLAVAGCGAEDDPRAEGRDGELLTAAANAEALLGAVYATPELVGDQALAKALGDASATRVAELKRLGVAHPEASASAEDYPRGVIGAADNAIAAYREGVRFFSKIELRATAIQFLTQVAGEQAALRATQNRDPSPRPFVTGEAEQPYVASDDTTSSTTTTTSTSTSTGG